MDTIVSIIFYTPSEMAVIIAKQAKAKRLELNLSQKTLSERSGVSYGTLKKFEQTGQISLLFLLKIALVLNCLEDFKKLFTKNEDEIPTSLDELLKDNTRKRGRK